MAIGDRLAIMRDGIIEQIGSSDEIYHNPANAFVSNFIGKMNFFPGRIVSMDGDHYQIQLDSAGYDLRFTPKVASDAQGAKAGDRITVGFRPEHLQIAPSPTEGQVRGRCALSSTWARWCAMKWPWSRAVQRGPSKWICGA